MTQIKLSFSLSFVKITKIDFYTEIALI